MRATKDSCRSIRSVFRTGVLSAAIGAMSAATAVAVTPVIGPVNPSNQATSTHVDSPFDLSATITNSSATPITGCEHTEDGSSWSPGVVVSSGTLCFAFGVSCTDTQSLTLNIRATNSLGETGTGSAVSRTCDTQAPSTTDNAPAAWQANDVTVTLSPSDTGSGVAFTQYCVDTTNSCTPNIGGTSVSVTCGVGSVCQKYVRYRSFDNVNNAESVKSALVRIDKQAPSGGSISYPNGNTSSPISVSFSEGSDGGGSGIGTRLLQRSQGTLQGNKCKNYGAFATIATDPTSPYSDSVSGPACYKYQYDVADQVGNHAVYTSSSEAKIH